MSWSATYVGLPYLDHGRDRRGVDCWGLARLVYRDELGIDLPSYTGLYASAEELSEVHAALADDQARSPWRKVDEAEPFDLFELRCGAFHTHVGVAVNASLMLHVHAGGSVCIERLAPRWSSRIAGIYRHVNRASKGV